MDLAAYRESEGLTLKALADRIGVQSEGYVNDIEKGRKPPSPRVAVRILRATGIKMGPITGLSDAEIAVLEKMHG